MGFVAVPMANEATQSDFQLTSRVEHTVSEHAFLNDAEEDLDLVDPRGVNRSVEEAEAIAVMPIETLPSLVFAFQMNVEIIPDDVELLSRIPACHGLHEIHDIDVLPAFAHFSVDVARVGIERGKKRPRSMSDILAVVSATASGRSDTQSVLASQSLHTAFFVDA